MQVRLKRSRFHPWVGKIPGEGFGNPSGIPAWRILWTEEPGGLQARGSQSRTWLQQFSMHTHTHTHSRKYKSTECQECQVGWPQLCKSISQLATYSAEYNIKCKIQQNGFILFTCFQTALWSYLFMVEAGQRWGRIRERSSMWCSSNTTDSELADGGRLKGIKLMIIVTWLVCACSVAKSCLILCDFLDCSPPCSSVHGILQARILEWVAISFSRGTFLTQGLNLGLLRLQANSLPLSHLGSPSHWQVQWRKMYLFYSSQGCTAQLIP